MRDRPRLYPPDPDDAALPEPWPEPDVVDGPASKASPGSSPRPAIVTDDDAECDDVTTLARTWDVPSARGQQPTTDEDEDGQGEKASSPITMAEIAAFWGGPRYVDRLPRGRLDLRLDDGAPFADDVPGDIRAVVSEWGRADPGDDAGNAADRVIAVLDRHGILVGDEFREAQGDTNHIPVGPAFGGGSPRYEVEGYGDSDFDIVEAESGRPVKIGIRKRSIAEAIARHLNSGRYEVVWICGEAAILASGVNGESRGQAAPGFPHPDADADVAGPLDSHSTDSTPIVGPGEWPWPWEARVGLGPESGPIDGPGGYAASDAALLDSLAAYDEGRRRWRLRAWLAGAVGLVAGVVLGVLLCWAAVEACLVYFAFGA